MNPIKIPELLESNLHIPIQYLLSEYVMSIGTRYKIKKEHTTDINLLLKFFGESSMDYNKKVLVFSDLILDIPKNVFQFSTDTFTNSNLFDYINPSEVHVIFLDADHYHTLKVNQVIEKFVRSNLGFLTIVKLE